MVKSNSSGSTLSSSLVPDCSPIECDSKRVRQVMHKAPLVNQQIHDTQEVELSMISISEFMMQ
jgi:hypothetical protein